MRLISAGSAVRVRPPAPTRSQSAVKSRQLRVQVAVQTVHSLSSLFDRVRRYAARHSLWTPETRVVAAVSGGSDSVALAFLLARSGGARRDRPRRPRASQSSRFAARKRTPTRRSAARWPTVSVCPRSSAMPTCRAKPATHGVSIEVAGRHARQRFFREALASVKADRVAVAHTRDDQAETVDAAAGARRGIGSGLAAMTPRRDHLIRPLLDVDAIGAAGFPARASTSRGARMRPISIARFLAISSATR